MKKVRWTGIWFRVPSGARDAFYSDMVGVPILLWNTAGTPWELSSPNDVIFAGAKVVG